MKFFIFCPFYNVGKDLTFLELSAGSDPIRWQHMEWMVPSWEQRHLCVLCSSEGHGFLQPEKLTAKQ